MRRWTILIACLAFFSAAGSEAWADAGFRGRSREWILYQVNFKGISILRDEVTFVIEGETREGKWEDIRKGKRYTSYGQFRLTIELPGQSTRFVTSAVTPRPFLNYLAVDLNEDGTGTLEQLAGPDVLLDLFFVRNLERMGLALAITLAIELLLVLVWTLVVKLPVGRLLLVGLVGNLLSLPVVWLMTGWSHVALSDPDAHWIVFWSVEAAAVLWEAFLYIRWGRMSRMQALLLAFLANTLSVVTGCLMVI